MFVFHKTEILRCLMSPNLNWYKSFETKWKHAKNTSLWFCTKSLKNGNGNIDILYHNFWINHNFELFSTSKWPSESFFFVTDEHTYLKKWPEMVVRRSFMKDIKAEPSGLIFRIWYRIFWPNTEILELLLSLINRLAGEGHRVISSMF